VPTFKNKIIFRKRKKEKKKNSTMTTKPTTAKRVTSVTFTVALSLVLLAAVAIASVALWPVVRRKRNLRRHGASGSGRLVTDQNRRYSDTLFLAAHNAFATYARGYVYAQQAMSLTDQLDYGVRALLLDLHWCDGGVAVAHGGCLADGLLRFPRSAAGFVGLRGTLDTIVAWMRANPSEVVTIFFEDYVTNMGSAKRAAVDYELGRYAELVYRPEDRQAAMRAATGPAAAEAAAWPVIGDLVRSGRRLLVFSDHTQTEYCHAMWAEINENRFSTVTFPALCEERDQSKRQGAGQTRTLVMANIFPKAPFELGGGVKGTFRSYTDRRARNTNSRATIAEVLACTEKRTGRPVNFLALDFVEKGDARAVVIEKNI
jgi:hypothetical protein